MTTSAPALHGSVEVERSALAGSQLSDLPTRSSFRRILGVDFFTGDALEAIGRLQQGGLVVVPAAPALMHLTDDRDYREALLGADLAITDSSFMVMIWNLLQWDSIPRLSGLQYLKVLLKDGNFREPHNNFWIMASEKSALTNVLWLRRQGIEVGVDDFCIAPTYGSTISDPELVANLANRRPGNIVVTIGGGTQERLGLYLKQHLDYSPAIHCIGAAIAFLSGDQVYIPAWADRLGLGWAFRCASSPRVFLKRYWAARKLASLIFRFRDQLPTNSAIWIDRLYKRASVDGSLAVKK
jgi:UDP-N-acetyl-D-mannosaminuronic acid transferase (WecB/TagA/CpsF family)